MPHFESQPTRPDGSPIVADGDPHNCVFKSNWHRPYSHATVAVIFENSAGKIALVARRPDAAAEGGKLALPGGYVELGQRLIDAAEAEAREETGYAVVLKTLGRFALMDGPTTLPGRTNETNFNVVTVFTAQAGAKVQDHDDEVTGVIWVPKDKLPPRREVAFGHYDIIGMWLRHCSRPFDALPIVPSEMAATELFLPGWR